MLSDGKEWLKRTAYRIKDILGRTTKLIKGQDEIKDLLSSLCGSIIDGLDMIKTKLYSNCASNANINDTFESLAEDISR